MAVITNTAITGISNTIEEDDLKISNDGSDGQFLQKQSGNTGGLTWATVSSSTEGTAVLSTGESGGTKFLREDGDNSSSWQAIPAQAGQIINVYTDKTTSETSTTTVDTWTDTDVSISLTPTAAANKFLCIWDAHALITASTSNTNGWGKVQLIRDTTALSETHGGNRSPQSDNGAIHGFGGSVWDHPDTTSAVTYKLRIWLNSQHDGNNITFNWSAWGFTSPGGGGNLTILEVKQ